MPLNTPTLAEHLQGSVLVLRVQSPRCLPQLASGGVARYRVTSGLGHLLGWGCLCGRIWVGCPEYLAL